MKSNIPVIFYNELNSHTFGKKYNRVISQLQQGDFASAEVKKLVNSPYYRARLDDKDRLLFTWVEYNGSKHLLLLEVITNHEYQKSRFLRSGVLPDESQWVEGKETLNDHVTKLSYLNPGDINIHALNKFISFDNEQADIYAHQPPMILIGSAGSGKTVLVLEKTKLLTGRILYISLSRHLVDNARSLYYANGYENEDQETDFLSFSQYLATWEQPTGKEINFRIFNQWFYRYAQSQKFTDAHKLYEEFCGVITGQALNSEYISFEQYLGLGIRQSVYSRDERILAYQLFEKYLVWMNESGYFESNIICHRLASKVVPTYDYIVVDEVQDITNAKLQFILKSLQSKNGFILTGDSNQIVHPNFFSWASVKTFFYTHSHTNLPINILHTNYRNSTRVVSLSNKLLALKNQRFGSIDKESNYLVKTNSTQNGDVVLIQNNEKQLRELNQRTVQSANYAVIVPKDEDKNEAAKVFKTPLLFSVHEAKGLEYENVILMNFVSTNSKEFNVISEGIDADQLNVDTLVYSRANDKSDKDGEVYKFFINSFYVALTRALSNIYIIENLPNHQILKLVGLAENRAPINIQTRQSTREEWLDEAQRLEKQGKLEQAEAIRAKFLGYDYMNPEELERVKTLALDSKKKENEVKKERKQLYAYAVGNGNIDLIEQLANLQFQRAMLYMKEIRQIRKDYGKNCRLGKLSEISSVLKNYGVDFRTDEDNATGLMLALRHNQPNIAQKLLELNCNIEIKDNNKWGAFNYLLNAYLRTKIKKQSNLANAKLLVQYWYRVRPMAFLVVTDRLVNLPRHRLYTLIFWLMQSYEPELHLTVDFKRDEDDKPICKNVFSIDDVLLLANSLPNEILAEDKKKRSTISGILSGNEETSTNQYSKRLFKRVDRGMYTIHPAIQIAI